MAAISNRQSPLIAPAARDWLHSTRNGRILHVFERAANLVNERAEVLALVTRPAALGPFALVVEGVDDPAGFLHWLDGTSAVQVAGERLLCGQLAIETAEAITWQPCPDWASLYRQRHKLFAFLPLLRSLLATEAPAGSLAEWGDLSNRPTPGSDLSNRFTQTAASLLCQGIVNGEIGLVKAGAYGLAGLGVGLTPAGDDFLVGAVVALWASWPEKEARLWAEAIASSAIPRTTTLSAAWLAAAGRGEVALLWHNLLEAVATAERDTVMTAARAILHTGHTSGADMLAGFLSTASLTVES